MRIKTENEAREADKVCNKRRMLNRRGNDAATNISSTNNARIEPCRLVSLETHFIKRSYPFVSARKRESDSTHLYKHFSP